MQNLKRKSLKKLVGVGAAASVLPNAWVKPVINSVVLPAHAQSTPIAIIAVTTPAPRLYTGNAFSDNGGPPDEAPTKYICAMVSEDRSAADVVMDGYGGPQGFCIKREGTIPIDGASGMMTGTEAGGQCTIVHAAVPATLTVSGSNLIYTLQRDTGPYVVTLSPDSSGSCPVPNPIPVRPDP